MGEINFDEDWEPEKTKARIDELDAEMDKANSLMSKLDKELKSKRIYVKKQKNKLAKMISNNMKYKQALVEDYIDKTGEHPK